MSFQKNTGPNAWPSIAGLMSEELMTDGAAKIGILGAPMTKGCVTPSDYHLAPEKFRASLKRISTYDLETATDLADLTIKDYGDCDVSTLSPKDGFSPIKSAFSKLTQTHDLSALIGGHNGITRAGVHALDPSLEKVGLLTLDAHFDLRSTENGLMNGNPVTALLEDGLPGHHIAQIGLAPFANTAQMHRTALHAGIHVYALSDCATHGTGKIIEAALKTLNRTCETIYVDFDIDVIDRAQSPGAPGGRNGGFSAAEFWRATRQIGAHPKVRAVDLTEFDPALDVSDITALISGRWFAELLVGYKSR
ncbi:MAG: arginase [Robiginitomaculum sp.]|nr:MAG: arginase [Robiginitomaculum sp.]